MDKKKLYLFGGITLGIIAIISGIIFLRNRSGVTASRKAERKIVIESSNT